MKSISLVLIILLAAFHAGAQTGQPTDTVKRSVHGSRPDVTLGPNAGNPLFLVNGAVSSVSKLTPNDITKLEILKDSKAAEEYGEVAINGVILVTSNDKEVTLPLSEAVSQYSGNKLSGNELFAINGLIIKKSDLPIAPDAIKKVEIIKKNTIVYLNVITLAPNPLGPPVPNDKGQIMIRGNAETARN